MISLTPGGGVFRVSGVPSHFVFPQFFPFPPSTVPILPPFRMPLDGRVSSVSSWSFSKKVTDQWNSSSLPEDGFPPLKLLLEGNLCR